MPDYALVLLDVVFHLVAQSIAICLQVDHVSKQGVAACVAAVQLAVLPLTVDMAIPPSAAALLNSPNAQIPRYALPHSQALVHGSTTTSLVLFVTQKCQSWCC